MLGIAVIRYPNSPLVRPTHPSFLSKKSLVNSPSIHSKTVAHTPRPSLLSRSSSDPSEFVSPSSLEDGFDDGELEPEPETEIISGDEDFEIEVEKVGKKNRRRIQSRIRVDADLETVWRVLTDYEGLADFIPSLAVSQLLEKKDKFARLFQVGQQNLGLGLKFNAKGVLDCYERDLEFIQTGRRRDIEFKMIEGDFQTFEGRWSIEQIDNEFRNNREFISGQEFRTTLSYVVELEPKLWLPVRLLEGRLCREVKSNLLCVREEAQRVQRVGSEAISTWEDRENNDGLKEKLIRD